MLAARFFGLALVSTLVASVAALGGCSSSEPAPEETVSSEEALRPVRSCALLLCAPGTHCEVNRNRASCVADPTDPCAVVRCASGTHCVADQGTASCVPDVVVTNPCDTVRCSSGYHCVADQGLASCVPDAPAPECSTDAGCKLWDNYCGGCTCLALPLSGSGPTCTNPVNCFAQPCFQSTAVCQAGKCVAASTFNP
jgi:hypothetical protein